METSPNTQAILLLTSRFGGKSEAAKPLAPKEWGRFAKWLHDHERKPEQLLRGDLKANLAGWSDQTVTYERVSSLLDRGSALALAVEKWYRSNLWVMTRADTHYPARLKKLLGYDSPAVLYGCGNQQLLNQSGLAVVGSRNAVEADLEFTKNLGATASNAGLSIISGGAKGVDQAAMAGALENEGTGVCVLADSLIRASSSLKYRRYLQAKNLVLITPFHPDAGFNAGNAMARNKYIYCLARAAVVVHSGNSGGTWNGANENLKKHWVPLWVKKTEDKKAGNQALVQAGAQWLADDLDADNLATLFSERVVAEPAGLFNQNSDPEVAEANEAESTSEQEPVKPDTAKAANDAGELPAPDTPEDEAATPAAQPDMQSKQIDPPPLPEWSLFDLFLEKVKVLTEPEPKNAAEIAEALEVTKSQVNDWLKRGVSENKIEKLDKPVRYQAIEPAQTDFEFDNLNPDDT